MGIFKKKEPQSSGIIGVDIGAGGMKVVELTREKGRMRLLTYGYAEVHSSKVLIDDPKWAAGVLRDVYKKAGMKSNRVNTSLPSHAVFHAIITIPVPKSPKEDIKPMIESQVKKLLPMPIEEMILDSTVIDKELLPKADDKKKAKKSELNDDDKKSQPVKSSGKHARVLVSGAPKEMVAKYVELFKQAKLQLVSLETEAFALIRSLIGNDRSRIMIVDVGYERTNISIVQQGIPFLHRSIKAGGAMVTEAIANQMGISAEDAEQTKQDLAAADVGEIPPVLKDALQPIVHEARYSLELFAAQDFHEQSTVEKIIITGGSAHLPYFDTFLTDQLNINVYLGDPWARVATPHGLRPVLNEVGPRFSVAIGLAMKDLDKR